MNSEDFQSNQNIKKRPHVPKVSEFLYDYIDSLGYVASEDIDALKEQWEDIVGSQLAKVVKPKKLENRVLTVSVTSSAWRSELLYMKGTLIKKINDNMRDISLQNIIFR